MKKILFICQANVGRSQMAEGFYNFFTQSSQAMSAGVEDFGEKYNFRPTADIVAAMAAKGIDISEQRIKVVSEKMVAEADEIVVLCARSLCPAFITRNTKCIFCEVTDPFGQDVRRVSLIRDEIEMLVKGLV